MPKIFSERVNSRSLKCPSMHWLYRFSPTEWGFVWLFLGGYALYFARTFWLARQLNTSAQAIIPKFFLRTIYLALLLISLLGPSFGQADQDVTTSGRDIYLLLDISRSMDATDVPPSRLERAKFDMQQLTDTLAANRFGLILFSTEAFVLSPLTADHDALNRFVRDARTTLTPRPGTNICAAIDLARQKLLADPSTRKSARAIVLFSDGEDLATCNRAVLAQLRAYDIPLITVGIGSESGSPIRRGTDFVRDEAGQIVRSRLNRNFLRNLARDGRGQYVEGMPTTPYVHELTGIIRTLRGRTIDQRRVAVTTNKYHYFLLVALFLIIGDVLIAVRTFRL